MPDKQEALVCDIQRFSIHDGPGIRTTIFFKGCSLACRWCQNPETIAFANELVYAVEKCINCGDCATVCKVAALDVGVKPPALNRSLCTACMDCVDVCPTEALLPAAKAYDPSSLLTEVLRDVDYYGETGGVTLSGGEPLLQWKFLSKFIPKAKEAGLHIVVETAGHVAAEPLSRLAGLIDLFLFDIKAADETRHRELTGQSNQRILENLKLLTRAGCRVEVRMPLIPGCNDDSENLALTARLLLSAGHKSVTLLPFHRLGESKFVKVKPPYQPVLAVPPSAEQMKKVAEFFLAQGIEVRS